MIRFKIWLKRLKAIAIFLFNATQLVSALIGIFTTSVGAAIIAWLLNYRNFALPLTAFSSGILITLIIVGMVYLRTSPTKWLLRGYRWIHAEYLYRIYDEDPKRHSQTITILLEAVRPGVDHFENRYLWSGRGREDDPKVLSTGHTLMGTTIQRALWKYYYIHLGHELTVGERTEIKIVQDLYDHEGKFEPFLAKAVFEPIDFLVLRVALPKNHPPSQVSLTEESGAVPTNKVVQNKVGVYDPETGEIRWPIQSPVLGHRYEIRWR